MHYFLFILILALREKALFYGSLTTSPSKYREMLLNSRFSVIIITFKVLCALMS